VKGCIYSRGKGTWALVIDLPRGADGKRRQKWITMKGTKRDAQAELTRIVHEMNTGAFVEPAKLTLGAFLETWLKDCAAPSVSKKTLEEYETCVRRHITPALGHVLLQKLKPAEVQAFYTAKGKSLSPARVRHLHAVLHRALEQAVKWQYVSRNIADAVEAPQPGKACVNVYDEAQVRQLLGRAQESAAHIGVVLAVYTGMRLGEILALKWSDVSLERGVVAVRQSLEQTKDGLRFKTPKSGQSRVVSLPDAAVQILLRHKGRLAERRLLLGEGYLDHGLVFPNEDGTPRKPDTFSKTFREFMERSGLPRIRFHDLRHTHATLLMQANVHPEIVSERLGHSTIAITMNTYSHVSPSMDRDAADTLGRKLGAAEG
jgi:integrase